MIQTGKVTASRYEKNRDGQRKVLMLQVRLSSVDDIQSVEYMQGAGDAHRPENGSKVLVVDNGSAYKIAVSCDDITAMVLELGERAISSVVQGAVKSSVLCKNDGQLVLNQGSDFALQFTALKTVVDALLVQLNAHVHVTPSGPSSPVAVPFVADITPAKVSDVNLGVLPVVPEIE